MGFMVRNLLHVPVRAYSRRLKYTFCLLSSYRSALAQTVPSALALRLSRTIPQLLQSLSLNKLVCSLSRRHHKETKLGDFCLGWMSDL